jgi:hypothetical protein
MNDLYSEKDVEAISTQLKKRYLVIGCIMAVFLAVFIYSMVIRAEWLSVLSLALFFAVAVFAISLFTVPLHRYKKLMISALTGRSHTESLEYKETEPEDSVVDGVLCVGLIFLGSPDKHGTREQRFYWDREIPLPAFRPGDQVTLKYTGRSIIGYQV